MPFDTPVTENAERRVTRLTKRYLAKPFWVLLVPFLFPSTLAAEPSLAETIQYIEAKISANKPHSSHNTHFKFRQIGQNIIHENHRFPWKTTYTFQLGALSTTVEMRGDDNYEVQVSCALGKCIRVKREKFLDSMKGWKEVDLESPERGGLSFWVNTNSSAEKLRKALTHAIELSGGKDELF